MSQTESSEGEPKDASNNVRSAWGSSVAVRTRQGVVRPLGSRPGDGLKSAHSLLAKPSGPDLAACGEAQKCMGQWVGWCPVQSRRLARLELSIRLLACFLTLNSKRPYIHHSQTPNPPTPAPLDLIF